MAYKAFFTIFITPFSRLKFTGMPSGLTVVGDVFKCQTNAIFTKLTVVTGIADGINIWPEATVSGVHQISKGI